MKLADSITVKTLLNNIESAIERIKQLEIEITDRHKEIANKKQHISDYSAKLKELGIEIES